ELADNGNIYLRLGLVDYADTEYTRAQSLDIMNPAVKSGKAMVKSFGGEAAIKHHWRKIPQK
ncbi:MAG: hypothetical protein II569_06290, partial [Paludibacteraceae bacterium]|nr:hypothetical protein [Paludibacteraceae bacterium]